MGYIPYRGRVRHDWSVLACTHRHKLQIQNYEIQGFWDPDCIFRKIKENKKSKLLWIWEKQRKDFIYLFMSVLGLNLCTGFPWLWGEGAIPHCGAQASHCTGFSCCTAWTPGRWASGVVAHGHSCPVTCGVFQDWGLNPCPLHWQADFLPILYHWTTMGAPQIILI